MTIQPLERVDVARLGAEALTTTRTCGFAFTTTGRPCANHVVDGVPWCRAGHPTASGADSADATTLPDLVDGARQGASRGSRVRRTGSRTRRATELLRQAMASEDADEVGLRAEHVLADGRTAVVQRFGRVGALLVLGYEERGRALMPPLTPLNGYRAVEQFETGDPRIECLVRNFERLDARGLYGLLCEIDQDEGFEGDGDGDGIDAHRWLHATYAIAARDGTPAAHQAYMRALDRVMRLVRPLLAS